MFVAQIYRKEALKRHGAPSLVGLPWEREFLTQGPALTLFAPARTLFSQAPMFRTGVVTPYAVAIGAVFSAFAVAAGTARLSAWAVCALLPVPWALAYAACRVLRAMPRTMSGLERTTGPWLPKGRKRYLLVAMPLNHFGEKVRFALDLIGAPYEEANVAGIVTIFLRGRSVPWLVDRLSCSHIGNSDQILQYLGAAHVPALPHARRAAAEAFLRRTDATLAWEDRLNGLGHLVQGFAYYYVLHADMPVVFALTTWGAFEPRVPWAQRLLLRAGAPLWKRAMRAAMSLDGPDAAQIRDRRRRALQDVFDEADAQLRRSGGPYLFGADLTYVDVSFAALLYPMFSGFLSPASAWANGRFSSYAEYAARHGEGLTPQAQFQDIREFERELRARPCGALVLRVYERRGALL